MAKLRRDKTGAHNDQVRRAPFANIARAVAAFAGGLIGARFAADKRVGSGDSSQSCA
jgi:hypothetical protein